MERLAVDAVDNRRALAHRTHSHYCYCGNHADSHTIMRGGFYILPKPLSVS